MNGEDKIFSEDYLNWVRQSGITNLTNNQHRFAEFLLREENRKIIASVGSYSEIFESVRKWCKDNPKD